MKFTIEHLKIRTCSSKNIIILNAFHKRWKITNVDYRRNVNVNNFIFYIPSKISIEIVSMKSTGYQERNIDLSVIVKNENMCLAYES